MTYKIILADPPWSYQNKVTGRMNGKQPQGSGAETKYPTMNLEDIKKLHLSDLFTTFSKDSVLFLWATTPLLPDAFEVMREWGYQYKTTIYWRKIFSLGMGFWFRGQVEPCLMGIRGDIKAFRCQKANFIQSKVRKHSQKPDQLYAMIESLGISPKIELFARYRREGWDAWGNEVSNEEQKILKECTQCGRYKQECKCP